MIWSKHENVRRPGNGRQLTMLHVSPALRLVGSAKHAGVVRAGQVRIRCALGRAGLTTWKHEGDGATPIGRFGILGWRFRPIRRPFMRGALPGRNIRRDDGWCDASDSGAYNRQVRLPFSASCEDLWRDDGKYDVVGILDCNFCRRRRGGGSAIFFHICGPDYGPTAGCVAIAAADLRKLLPRLSVRSEVRISR
jgi:L,D-peptidoglycan transpeptidase YkuD (ErfK/YbiS/YcfS/YnhG family)